MLIIDDVHTYYGQSYVLHGVSLEVPVGKLTALMGRNGVGKTTLCRSVMGMSPPRRGKVSFDGVELTGKPSYMIAREGVAIVPQGRRIFPTLTVGEHLEKVGRPRQRNTQWPVERIVEIFPRLGERWAQRAGHLSGGEQSMLAIARALRLEPRCLLLDEPMEGLSPVFVQTVVDVIRELRREGDLSILLVIPELAIALDLADHVCVMGTGQIAFSGSPDELRAAKDIQARYIGVG